MVEAVDRTFICSVVFLDIVGYSRESVEQQLDWKEQLNSLITQAMHDLPDEQRILLDTGDGAALCFLGDPETALIASMRLVDGLLKKNGPVSNELLVRIGINLGAVKVVRDINGQPNIVGDGINVAQRVMSFAQSNQILASRSFYEVVSCLTREYQRIFVARGVHKDKHSREHEVYEIRPHGATAGLVTPATTPARPENTTTPAPTAVAPASSPTPPVPSLVIDAALGDRLNRMLSGSIGPMATIVLKRAIKSAPNFKELCRILSEQIPTEAERQTFLKQATALLPKDTVAPGLATNTPTKSAPLAPNSAAKSSNRAALTQSVIDGIEDAFIKILGPMAKLLLKRELLLSESPADLVQRLCTHIDNTGERKKFEDLTKKFVD